VTVLWCEKGKTALFEMLSVKCIMCLCLNNISVLGYIPTGFHRRVIHSAVMIEMQPNALTFNFFTLGVAKVALNWPLCLGWFHFFHSICTLFLFKTSMQTCFFVYYFLPVLCHFFHLFEVNLLLEINCCTYLSI